LVAPPESLQLSHDKKVAEFDEQKVGHNIFGVVMRFKKKKVYKHLPLSDYFKKRIEVLSVVLQVGSDYIRIFLPGDSSIKAGQILEAFLEDIIFDERSVLFAKQFEVVIPSEKEVYRPKLRINLLPKKITERETETSI